MKGKSLAIHEAELCVAGLRKFHQTTMYKFCILFPPPFSPSLFPPPALVTLLIFGLWHRQSEEGAGVDEPGAKMTPTCCSWRRVSQYDEDDAEVDADLRDYATRVAVHRGFGFFDAVGGGVGGGVGSVEGLTAVASSGLVSSSSGPLWFKTA